MTTLEKLVESIKIQLKPHITDDVVISEEWLIDIINQSRGAMLIKKYVANENFINYYQEITLDTVIQNKFTYLGIDIPFRNELALSEIPELIQRIGRKNIDYVGSVDHSTVEIQYVDFNELIAYQHHRFGNSFPCYTIKGNTFMVRNSRGQSKWLIRALFGVPNDVPGFDYSTSRYPIDEADIRQLEILTFQHIAPKLGMPVDVLNNGQDETKNAAVNQQVKQSQQQEE